LRIVLCATPRYFAACPSVSQSGSLMSARRSASESRFTSEIYPKLSILSRTPAPAPIREP
jgi:hypothetical protein